MGTVTILALADEVDETLSYQRAKELRPDVVLSCGDLPFDYLEMIVTATNAPCLFVPGNHDPEIRTRRALEPMHPIEELDPDGPRGCIDVDRRVVEVAGLLIGGLGGSARYSGGPHQYTQRQMRARSLWFEARYRLRHRSRPLDVLITHAPPMGLGDDTDPAHVGFASFHRLISRVSPKLFLHGHIHPYGRELPDRTVGRTRIVNVVPRKLLQVDS